MKSLTLGCGMLGLALLAPMGLRAGDQPQWGRAWDRNLVSSETGLPEFFEHKGGQNIRWKAQLGTESHSTPVVSAGRVYVGTNNGNPRDPKHQGDRGVMMCFEEATGNLLWQLVCPKREEDPYHDWPKSGISSPASVEGDRVYLVSNRGEVLCLDARGMANGNGGVVQDEGARMAPAGQPPMEAGPLDADILWSFNLTKELGIWSHDAAHSSILIHGNHLYLNTGTGVDNTHKKIRTPDAPSLVVLDKRDGRLLGRENEGKAGSIFHCTWSSPSMGRVDGKDLVFFAGGDGVVYAYEPLAADFKPGAVANLKQVWRFDFDPGAPKTEVHRYNQNRRESPSNIYGLPVFHEGSVLVAGGGDLFWGKNECWIKRIRASGSGDVTESGLMWSTPLERHTVSTPAIHNGLVFIADCARNIHCLDLETGAILWTHATRGEIWASPLVADGKVYLGTRSGDFWILAASREKRVLFETKLESGMSATTTAANGRILIATMENLYSVAAE